MNKEYNLRFEPLCSALGLGELTAIPEIINGGLLHRMFSVQTGSGHYAVKALNPQIMERPTARDNYIQAEKFVHLASRHVPAQPAKIINGAFMQELGGQYYLIFDWIDGSSLKGADLDTAHCAKMGVILADIHNTDCTLLMDSCATAGDLAETDWMFYLEKGKGVYAEWLNLMEDYLERLTEWSQRAKRSFHLLSSEMVWSHRDLEPKNVMWAEGNPVVIDWESAGAINPKHDLLETAIYWSIDEDGQVNRHKFMAFIQGYLQRNGNVQADWRAVLELGYLSKLDWLEYSLKRSLWIECTDQAEQEMGTEHVTGTIQALNQYAERVAEIEGWMMECGGEREAN